MVLTTPRRYNMKPIHLGSGQVVTLPGSDVFDMPHGIPSEVDIYDIDTLQRYPLGTKLEQGDRRFRYIEYGGTTKAGDVLSKEVTDDAHDVLDPTGTGTGAGIAAGDKIISIADSLTLVVDEYAGGQMLIEDGAGNGYNYMIEANEVAAGVSNALLRIKHGLAVAVTATTNVRLVKSKWKELIIGASSIVAASVGIGVGVGADGSFGWMLTRGEWSVLTNGTLIIARNVVASETTAGAVDPRPDANAVTDDRPSLGVVTDVGASTAHSLIDIQIE